MPKDPRYSKYTRNKVLEDAIDNQAKRRQKCIRAAKNLMVYVNSCIHYEKILRKNERKQMEAFIEAVGGVYNARELAQQYIDLTGPTRSHGEALVEAAQRSAVSIYNYVIEADSEPNIRVRYIAMTNAYDMLDVLESTLSSMIDMQTIKMKNPRQLARLISECRSALVSWIHFVKKEYKKQNPEGKKSDLNDFKDGTDIPSLGIYNPPW